MLLLSMETSPLPTPGKLMNGMIFDRSTGMETPGMILKLWKQLRESVGVIVARKKKVEPGAKELKFKVRSAEELVDKIREKCNELGILVYPGAVVGHAIATEDGTLAEVQLTVIAQAIEDGSSLQFAGFGLGADYQDKAGGKAGTYAFKQALIQALLAGGTASAKALGVHDTDDDDAPIKGGVKPKQAARKVTPDELRQTFDDLEEGDADGYGAALKLALTLDPKDQLTIKDSIAAASARCKGKKA